MNAAPYKIVTVCTGNICRSPLAEALLRESLDTPALDVSSAGIMAAVGGSVPRQQLRIAAKLGVRGLETHRPQPLTRRMIEDADLVLGMSRGHRKRIVRMDPEAVRRTFTIREFARLAPLVTVEDVEVLVANGMDSVPAAIEAVASKRGLLPPPKFPEEFDVIDPFKQKKSVYKLSRDELVPAVKVTGDFLASIIDIFGAERTVREDAVIELDAPAPLGSALDDIAEIAGGQGEPLSMLPKRSVLRRTSSNFTTTTARAERSIPTWPGVESRGA